MTRKSCSNIKFFYHYHDLFINLNGWEFFFIKEVIFKASWTVHSTQELLAISFMPVFKLSTIHQAGYWIIFKATTACTVLCLKVVFIERSWMHKLQQVISGATEGRYVQYSGVRKQSMAE